MIFAYKETLVIIKIFPTKDFPFNKNVIPKITKQMPFINFERMSDKRIEIVYHSRMAIIHALQDIGISANFSELEILNNHHLKDFPETLISISHTDDFASVYLAQTNKYKSIGIDIEKINRQMKFGANRFFDNQQDQTNLSQLEVWCVKEAAFKAISPLWDEQLVLSNIWIKDNKFGIETDRALGLFKKIPHTNVHCFVATMD